MRHTSRGTIAEEHHWRHVRTDPAGTGWQAPPAGTRVVRPASLAIVYRALRKSCEDSRNEPGAAGFHYGEMASRLTEPVVPGLAALAVRGRIKRWSLGQGTGGPDR